MPCSAYQAGHKHPAQDNDTVLIGKFFHKGTKKILQKSDTHSISYMKSPILVAILIFIHSIDLFLHNCW